MSNENSEPQKQDTQKRMRRATRYTKAQERRMAQARADQKFYAQMFTVCGVLALFVIGLGMVAMYGVSFDGEAMSGWTEAWFGPFSKLELAGLVFVACIGAIMYYRMRKRG